ncbi:MAG: zinc-ribbon domain-containing protein [Pseudomonadota bacterium]
MRITCPRCNACYEVPDAVMPPGGRDVQCSDCGHSWYQLIAGPADEDQSSASVAASDPLPQTQINALASTPPDAPETSDESEETKRLRRLRAALDEHKSQRPVPETLSLSDHATQDTFQIHSPPDPDIEEPDPAPTEGSQRELDPAVAEVLRAEAEFERQARLHGSAVALEMQPELGLVQPSRKNRDRDTVRDRLARLQEAERDAATAPLTGGEESFPDPSGLARGLGSDTGTVVLPATRATPGLPVHAPRRALTVVEQEAARARKGFRWGFAASLTACAAVAGLYSGSPYLAGLLPDQATFFENVARTGANWHVALAERLQETFERFNAWVTGITPPSA